MTSTLSASISSRTSVGGHTSPNVLVEILSGADTEFEPTVEHARAGRGGLGDDSWVVIQRD
jgi:hypothetical protein